MTAKLSNHVLTFRARFPATLPDGGHMPKMFRPAFFTPLFLIMSLAITTAAGQQTHTQLKKQQQRRQLHWQRYLHEHSDPTGKPRPDLLRKAVAQIKQMPIAAGVPISSGGYHPGSRSSSGGLAPMATLSSGSSPLTGVQWTQIGPAPLVIDAQQNFQGNGPDSGQVLDIAIDPRNSSDQVIYIATNDGGIWKSVDGGTNWSPMTDYMPSNSMGAVALDPTNPSVVYAGTGDDFNDNGRFFGNIGIFKSIDAGQTWVQLGTSALTGRNTIRIVVISGNVVLVATDGGLFRSVDGGQNFGSNSPTYNNNAPLLSGYISDLHVDTATATTVFAAVTGKGIYSSTDSGATFTNLFTSTNGAPTANVGMITFGQSTKPDNKTFYAAIESVSAANPGYANFKGDNGLLGIYTSTDGGQNWTKAAAGGNPGNNCQCGYDQPIAVDPQDATHVYVAFQDIWESTDSAANFAELDDNASHDDVHALVFSPLSHASNVFSSTPLYIGSDGGIDKTFQIIGIRFFSALNGASGSAGAIATNVLRGIDIGRGSSSNNVYTYGGAQDTGISQHSPGDALNDWHLHIDGDGGLVVVDPSNPLNAYSSDDGSFERTTDGGQNWNGSSGLPGCAPFTNCANPLVVDANNGSNVYVSGADGKLYFSTDQGATFKLMKDFSANSGVGSGSMAQIDSNTMWVGLGDGSVWYTHNALSGASSTWTQTTATGTVGGQTAFVTVDPANTAQAVAVYPGFCNASCAVGKPTKHVFYTTDSGSTWKDISPSVDVPLHTVVIDPSTSPHSVIVGSDAAVLRTADLGTSWQVFGVGLPTVLANSLALDPSASPALLRLGTYGRSSFELTAATGPLLAINADLAFGSICVGGTTTLTIQLFNVGSSTLNIGGIVPVAGSSGDFQVSGPATPVDILPGEELDFTVSFTPKAADVGQNLFAVFQINSTDQFQPTKLVYASASVAAPSINATIVNSGNFGNVCPAGQGNLVLQITNQSQCNLSVSNVTSSNSTLFLPPTLASKPLILTADATVDLPISFQPPSNQTCSNTTPLTGTITVVSNDPTNGLLAMPVQGTVPCPSINATISNTGSFGNVCGGTHLDLNLNVINQGQCNLNISSITSTDPTFFALPTVSGGTPLTLPGGSSVNLPVRFQPVAYNGPGTPNYRTCSNTVPQTATIALQSNDPTYPGPNGFQTGVQAIEGCPTLTLTPQKLNGIAAFPATVSDPTGTLGCFTDKQIQVTNTGICPLIVPSGGLSASPSQYFSVVNTTTPLTIAPGTAPVPITVRFKPTTLAGQNSMAPDQQLGSLSITSNDPVAGDDTAGQADGLCGEPVYHSGARVLVVDTHSNPVSSVAKLTLSSKGLNPSISQTLMPAPLLGPVSVCGNPIRYHLDNETLKPAGTTGNNPLASYVLNAKNGNTQANMSFTLGQCQMQQIILQIK